MPYLSTLILVHVSEKKQELSLGNIERSPRCFIVSPYTLSSKPTIRSLNLSVATSRGPLYWLQLGNLSILPRLDHQHTTHGASTRESTCGVHHLRTQTIQCTRTTVACACFSIPQVPHPSLCGHAPPPQATSSYLSARTRLGY